MSFPIEQPQGGWTERMYQQATATYLWEIMEGNVVLKVRPVDDAYSSWTTVSFTVAGGAGWTTLPEGAATLVQLLNYTGTTLDVASPNGGQFIQVQNNTGMNIAVVGNGNEVRVRRHDQAAGSVDGGAVYYN